VGHVIADCPGTPERGIPFKSRFYKAPASTPSQTRPASSGPAAAASIPRPHPATPASAPHQQQQPRRDHPRREHRRPEFFKPGPFTKRDHAQGQGAPVRRVLTLSTPVAAPEFPPCGKLDQNFCTTAVMPSGQTMKVIVDTGAQASCISASQAQALGLSSTPAPLRLTMADGTPADSSAVASVAVRLTGDGRTEDFFRFGNLQKGH